MLAEAVNLDPERFARTLNDTPTQAELLRQIEFSKRLGALGFPSLVLEDRAHYRPITYDYIDPTIVLAQLGL